MNIVNKILKKFREKNDGLRGDYKLNSDVGFKIIRAGDNNGES